MTEPRPVTPPDVVDLARRALNLAKHDDLQGASRVVARLAREHPQTGVWMACQAWCDTLVANVPALRDADPTKLGGVGYEHLDTGQRSGADGVPPGVRWAGRFLTARVHDDVDTARALFASFTNDRDFGDAVMALLSMVALNLIEQQRVQVITEELPS